MIEARKPCLEIAQKLQAVEMIVVNSKRADPRSKDHCLDADRSSEDYAELKIIAR